MRLRSAPWITACVLGALVSACRATQERAFAPAPSSERQSQAPADQGSGGSDGSFFGRPSYRLYGGTFEAEGNPGLANESHNATLGFGMSFPVRANPHWALDVDLIGTDRDYVASTFVPGQGVFNGTASLRTVGLTAGPRGTARAGPVRGYLGAGLGLFGSELAGAGTLAGQPLAADQSDFSPGLYGLAGVDVRFGALILGLSYRYWWFEGSFSDFGLNDIELGGHFAGIVIGVGL